MLRVIFKKGTFICFMVVEIHVGTAKSVFGQPSYDSSYTRLTGYCPMAILVPGYLP